MLIPIRLWLTAAAAVTVLGAQGIYAQIGNDNPTGPSGTFNGNVTTGCSYDPYTGNARRAITDIVVPGSVGAYPLAFTRVANSRGLGVYSNDHQFGEGGSWRHSYSWYLNSTFGLGQATEYDVDFPDGRQLVFTPSSSDSCFRAGAGVRERFLPLDLNTMLAYLLLPDGGKVEFTASPFYSYYTNGYNYQATAIIDPYGQRTSLTYNWDGSLNTIQEPGGRWLQIIYQNDPWQQYTFYPETNIDHVQSSDGRVVQYYYNGGRFVSGGPQYTWLTSVVYPADPGMPAPTAYYSYQASNVAGDDGSYHGIPLLVSCDDPMYEGPMKRISYTYATGQNPDGSPVAAGQIFSEKSSVTGQAVSTLVVDSTVTETRTEIRGDGPSRTFNYSGGKLVNYTDFKGQYSYISYDGTGYTSAFTDAGGHTTSFLREGIIGAMSVLTHPDQSIQGYAYWYSNDGPYYVQIRGDERGHNTYFTRDGNFQLTRIDYPDYPNGAYEEFSYNGFGQVTYHRMTSGGTETFYYDSRGMKYASSNPDGTSYYYYDGYDRLEHSTDPRGNTTWFQYNARGQVTRLTHQDGSYVQSDYNQDGTLASVTDELGHTTSYTYDDYKRVLTVTNPVSQVTTYCYALDWANPLLHTSNSIKYVLSPLSKNIVFDYDANLRKIDQVAALGTPDEAWTLFEYDPVGNLTKVTDPLGHATAFGYDNRNRQTTITDALGYVTTTNYDSAGNKMWIKCATGASAETIVQFPDYDPMNRLTRQIDERGVTTTMGYDLAGNLIWNNDGNNNHYAYEYDGLNRRKKMTFPDGTTEEETYDAAGNPATHKNRAGNIQFFYYDNRNRQFGFDWNDGFTPQLRITYDAASRATQIWNWDATIDLTYFDDGTLRTQTETTGDYGDGIGRTVAYGYDADGNRATMDCPSGRSFAYGYTGRNQLRDISLTRYLWAPINYGAVVSYSYDPAGNRTGRSLHNGTYTAYGPADALNRIPWVQHTYGGGQTARFDYDYDSMNRLKYEERSSGDADSYSYDQAGQITGMIWRGTFNNGTVNGNPLTIDYDNAGNRTQAWGNTYGVNSLNEYSSLSWSAISSDVKGNVQTYDGWTYTYDAQNRLRSAIKGATSLQFWYDGLNRQITRNINGYITFNVWDGWNLIEEYGLGNDHQRFYLHGANPDEMVAAADGGYPTLYYTQDGRGNTSHLFGEGNDLYERYVYGLAGGTLIFDPSGNARSESAAANRFFFQGRDFLKEGGIYDYRNRFYHSTLGRFLQPDPLAFAADAGNLYRYCGNDPVNRRDPTGLHDLGDDAEIAAWNWSGQNHDYDYDVRYGMMDDFAGLEGGSYLRDVFARNDAASQRFDAYSSARAELSMSLGLLFESKRGSESDPNQPIGYEVFGDDELYAALDKAHLQAHKLPPGKNMQDFFKAMANFDTGFYHNVCYYYSGNIGNMGGYWSGYEVNYIGVGEGFAAGGFSLGAMDNWISAYNYYQGYTYPMLQGKMDWAKVGYDDYLSRHH